MRRRLFGRFGSTTAVVPPPPPPSPPPPPPPSPPPPPPPPPPPSTLTAPTFLAYSGVGDTSLIASYGLAESGIPDPPQFWFQYGNDVGEGDYVEFQIDTVNTYGSGNLRTQSRILQYSGTALQFADPVTFVPGDFTIETGLTPSTTYFMRRRIRRDYGDSAIYSNWTPNVTVSVTSAGITTAWNPSDASTWNGPLTFTNSNRTVTMVDAGANDVVRSTSALPTTGKYFGSFIINAQVGSTLKLGFATAGYGNAGVIHTVGDGLANFSKTFWVTGGDLYRGNDGSVSGAYVATVLLSEAAGDRIDWAFRSDIGANGTVWFGKGGDFSHHGDPVAGTGGYAVPFAGPLFLLAGCAAATQGDINTVSIDTLANAAANKPSSAFIAVGA